MARPLTNGIETSPPHPRLERQGRGETWCLGVRVIDPRGNEGLRVLTLKE